MMGFLLYVFTQSELPSVVQSVVLEDLPRTCSAKRRQYFYQILSLQRFWGL